METTSDGKVYILGVPINGLSLEDALGKVKTLLEGAEHHQIVPLTMENFRRARRDPEFSRAVRQAPLVFSVTRTLTSAARVLGRPTLEWTVPFDLIIRLLAVADEVGASVYLLGARKEHLERTEKNLKASFPQLKIVGRYAGFYTSRVEQDIITAIRKSAPRVLLVGSGVPGAELWPLRHRKQLSPGISLWVGDCFEVFAGARRQIPRGLYAAGLESYAGCLLRPWRLLRVFPRTLFWIQVLVSRIRGL